MSFILGITGWASETPPDEANALFGTTELSVHIGSGGDMAGQAGLRGELYGNLGAGPASGERTAPLPEPEPGAETDEFTRAQIDPAGAEANSHTHLQRQEEAPPSLRSAPAADHPKEQLALPIAESRSEERAGGKLAETGNPVLPGVEDGPPQPSAGAAPIVEVRVGSHGDHERVVFEWPEGIEYDVVQRAEQVTVVFSRAGRIDLSKLRAGFGQRVVEARAAGGEVTDKVVLRVVPDARIRTLSLDDGRIVAIDVYAETGAQTGASPAPQPAQAVFPAPQPAQAVFPAPQPAQAVSPAPQPAQAVSPAPQPAQAVSPAPQPAQAVSPAPQPAQDAIQALREALERRDEVIENLLVRVEQLERRLALSSGDLDQVVAGGAGAGALGSAPPPPAPAQPPIAPPEAPPEPPAATAQQAPPADASQGAQPAGNAQSAPGEFAVDEEDIDRALERTLVQTGVLLLPFGQAEVEPYFGYTRREGDQPVLFVDGIPGVANQQVRRNEFITGQILRVGLPFDSQVELDLPYRYVDQSVVTPTGFGQREENDSTGHGLGDLRIGLAKTLVRENGGWWPDLVARVTWDTNTGNTTDNDVVLGGGFNELRGSLSAIKRQDPLAFIGGISYEKTFENDDVEPGDALGFSLGTVLAASPGTSLRLALNQTFSDTAKFDGEGIDGSDRVVGTATLGASVVLGRGVLLDVAADIGLTDDAPDYAARASLPIRFNLPVY